MGEKPQRYWDADECRWVRYAAVPADEVPVPAQGAPADERPLAAPQEADVRSG
jgi:hypothetical protein